MTEDALAPAGSYVDGQSAQLVPVIVSIANADLQIRDATTGAAIAHWRLPELIVEAGDDHLRIQCHAAPDAEVTLEGPAGAMLHARLRGLQGVGVAASTHSRRRRLMLIYGGAIAGLVTAVYLALPAISRTIARRIPLETEATALGDPLAERLVSDVCRTPASDAALAGLRARLDPAGDVRAVDIINLDLMNAFTVPGGRVYLTRELVDEARSIDEIAGVLAHEFEHVRQRHIMAYVVRSSILSLGWAVTVGDFSGLLVIDPSTAFQIINLRFSRADEASADAGAIGRLRAAGIPTDGIIAFFERLRAKSDGAPEWLQTHPLSERRIRMFRDAGNGATAKIDIAPIRASAFQDLRGACAGRTGKRSIWDALRDRKPARK